ncbi:MAG: iron ABC transporter permease [Deltaproteobacteria bacterium]|nr:iron ABC transporter permease [Deltaproteobacteria bacterium]MCL5793130.1 iron ABC transporter permease [Deltaproteobacteria bacterium]
MDHSIKKSKNSTGQTFIWVLIILCLVITFIFAVVIGPVNIPFSDVVKAIFHHSTNVDSTIILSLRLPRAIAGVIVGGALGISGVIFQGILRNPLADPYILGISSGAALGATIAQTLLFTYVPVSISAFVGAMCAMLLVYGLSRSSGSSMPLYLVLAGFAISALLGSIMAFVIIVSNSLQIKIYSIMLWLMGGLRETTWHELMFISVVFAVLVFLAVGITDKLDILALGDEKALSLGMHVEYTRIGAMAIGAILTGIAVYLSGLVGFVGLVIPHITRLLIGPSHKRLIIMSFLIGAVFLLLSDLIARIILKPVDVPVGIITSLIGAPFFLFLLLKAKKGYRF